MLFSRSCIQYGVLLLGLDRFMLIHKPKNAVSFVNSALRTIGLVRVVSRCFQRQQFLLHDRSSSTSTGYLEFISSPYADYFLPARFVFISEAVFL